MTDRLNIHPADELQALREEIKQMEAREAVLRAELMRPGADLSGKQYQAYIQTTHRETLDKNALIADLGLNVVAPYIKRTEVNSLKLVPQMKE